MHRLYRKRSLKWPFQVQPWSVLHVYPKPCERGHDKTSQASVRPAKTQISLGTRMCTQWVARDPSFLHADSEDSDQALVFTGRTVTLLVLSCCGSCYNEPCYKEHQHITEYNKILIWSGFYGTSKLFYSFCAKAIVKYLQKWEIPKKKHLTTHKENLVRLTWPDLGSNSRTQSGEMKSDLEP